ncbi:MAG: NosD domain-containing protein [Candidatus Bathyarchaeia archaeon]
MKRKMVSTIALTLLLTSLLTLAFNIQPTKAEPRTWTVDDDGPADFHTIQEAMDASSDGDTVFVYNGTYYENVVVRSNVSLVGENRIGTIIDGNASAHDLWAQSAVRLWTSSNVTGFTIRNGGFGVEDQRVVGFFPVFTGNRIEDNLIVNNVVGAIFLRGCANDTVSNNVIANNALFGIHLWNAGNNTITNNTVVENGYGIDLYGNCYDNTLRNNNMTDNDYNFGLILLEQTWNWIFGLGEKPGLYNDVDASNTVNGKPIYYWVNRRNEQVPSDAGYVWLNNCTGITIDGVNLSGNLQGILLHSTNNTSVRNCTIDNNVCGIYLLIGNNNTLVGNTLNDNLEGIYPGDFSMFTTMRNNSISGGQMNFGLPPKTISRSPNMDPLAEFLNDIDMSNTVDGKPIIYWINQHDQKVPTDAGCVILINCTNISVEDLNLTKNVQGVLAVASNNTIIANNSISDTVYAIDAKGYRYLSRADDEWLFVDYTSFNTTVKRNMIVDNGVGMRISSNSSIITNNTVLRDPLGIYLPDAFGSIISGNLVNGSDIWSLIEMHRFPELAPFFPEEAWVELSPELRMLEVGAMILGGSYNLVQDNTFADSFIGISTGAIYEYGSGNLIFHNNLINDTSPAAQAPGINFWNTAYPSGGNYWSKYNGTDFYSGPYQNETGSDGVGDTSFSVFVGNIDLYPLMAPCGTFDAGSWNETACNVYVVSNSSVSGFQADITQKTLSFNVTGSESTAGFSRVAIPNIIVQDLWQGNYTVLLNGEPCPFRNWTDTTNTYIYVNYTHSQHQITIVPEFPSLLILPLFMIVTLLAVIAYKRKKSK